jgi:ABC-type multidrug transport system ATPase subunit
VHKGKLFGFLRANGAGKTTATNMLTGPARSDFGYYPYRRSGMHKKTKAYSI